MLEENVSALTTLPEDLVKYIGKYMPYIHSHSIATQIIEKGGDIFELELFEGTLMLMLENDNVKYKFIPNDDFSKVIVETILNKKSLLVDGLSDKIKRILEKAYKDVL